MIYKNGPIIQLLPTQIDLVLGPKIYNPYKSKFKVLESQENTFCIQSAFPFLTFFSQPLLHSYGMSEK